MSTGNEMIVLVVLGLLMGGASALACGPFATDEVLDFPTDRPTGAPETRFVDELRRLLPEKKPTYKALLPDGYYGRNGDYRKTKENTNKIASADLERALGKTANARPVLQSYGLLRNQMRESTDDFLRLKKGAAITAKIPKNLPDEFREYLTGAIHYVRGDHKEAVAAWKRVLALPEGKRQYRSTWAAFMIGKVLLKDNPREAIQWFQMVRKLTDKGFGDSLGLAAASYGREAQIHYRQQDYPAALALYIAQLHTGDQSAIPSIQYSIYDAIENKKLKEMARDSLSQKLVTVFLIARGGPFLDLPNEKAIGEWLVILEGMKAKDMVGTDRLALLAYKSGKLSLARRLLTLAPKDAFMANWLRAKFMIRDGEINAAAKAMAKLSQSFPVSENLSRYLRDGGGWTPHSEQLRGDLGVLRMSRREYSDALHVLLIGGYWRDAMYVAENVLTVDELIKYVDKRWAAEPKTESGRQMKKSVRSALARRLTRLGRWKEGRAYFDKELAKTQTEYIDAIRKGHNKKLSQGARSEAFWKAATIAWEHGTYFLDPCTAPSWRNRKTANPLGGTAEFRIDPKKESDATADERDRLKERLKDPANYTIHRYTAAAHAWSALELMPDDTDLTATRFIIAGSWLKHHDPKAADKFYKALVRRCGGTELGARADKLRWFPALEDDKNQL